MSSCLPLVSKQVRELTDAEFPHSFLVSGKQRTLELQARSQEEMISWMQVSERSRAPRILTLPTQAEG